MKDSQGGNQRVSMRLVAWRRRILAVHNMQLGLARISLRTILYRNCAVLCCAVQSAISACVVAVRNGSFPHMLLFLHHKPPVVSSTSAVSVLHNHPLFKLLHALPSAEAQEWERSVACAARDVHQAIPCLGSSVPSMRTKSELQMGAMARQLQRM